MNRKSSRHLGFASLLLVLALSGCWKKESEEAPKPTATTPAGQTTGAQVNPATPAPVATNAAPSAPAGPTNQNPDLAADAQGLSKATVILTTNQGVIKFKFYPKDAPNTVTRIVELINKGFYNGLSFHRVVPDFVIQGGDPKGTGEGGSGQKLKAEFNDRKHVEGTVAMARASDPDSADSQFYICLATLPHLDRNYTVFGQTIEGLDVIKKIKVGDKIISMIIQ